MHKRLYVYLDISCSEKIETKNVIMIITQTNYLKDTPEKNKFTHNPEKKIPFQHHAKQPRIL